jgi:hypothetical protein
MCPAPQPQPPPHYRWYQPQPYGQSLGPVRRGVAAQRLIATKMGCMTTPWRDKATGKRLGSPAGWRKLRLSVADRDKWICRLCRKRIDPRLRSPDPMSLSVHHTINAATLDPRFLVATHRKCNMDFGSPDRHNLQPKIMTNWDAPFFPDDPT